MAMTIYYFDSLLPSGFYKNIIKPLKKKYPHAKFKQRSCFSAKPIYDDNAFVIGYGLGGFAAIRNTFNATELITIDPIHPTRKELSQNNLINHRNLFQRGRISGQYVHHATNSYVTDSTHRSIIKNKPVLAIIIEAIDLQQYLHRI